MPFSHVVAEVLCIQPFAILLATSPRLKPTSNPPLRTLLPDSQSDVVVLRCGELAFGVCIYTKRGGDVSVSGSFVRRDLKPC
ncbi:hypothetical protein BU24DRAFT_135513 [Aaosphaeria arxii CBS 175.79]|uniref:Uncharacterized protein n=1 Tax=Aaosphaeria arxii CBS 175.79 TaxID=1450172 RepID=A0A6A5Y3V2_9PLEO|nr:uncharacterized protein BU24DRAFT_135513 [Aaosphaeria arxii CBS 175.79]KAF2020222.1 hypothetical protein BU24DRAFT_135513 [Aaosphaeria arxii CBS 175.79]